MNERCIYCGSDKLRRNGTKDGVQQWYCNNCRKYFRQGQTPITEAVKLIKEPQRMGINENELRKRHDVRYQVEQAVKELKHGVFLTSSEFIQLAKIKAGQGYRNVIDHPDFDSYKGRAGSVTYWSHPDSITKLKNDSVLT